jgi:hypothetical protein
VSIFGQSLNIASVTVNGQEGTQDFDLDGELSFDLESDAGNRYTVTVTPGNPKKHQQWQVTQRLDSGETVEVGTVWRVPMSFDYQFTATDAFLSGGSQGNLWNAAQSLIR